jgi:hypothetical protein
MRDSRHKLTRVQLLCNLHLICASSGYSAAGPKMRAYALTLARLLQVGANKVDEVFGNVRSDGFCSLAGKVQADVVFHDLGHEAVDSAADGGELHEDLGAFVGGLKRTLHGGDLSADALDPVQ